MSIQKAVVFRPLFLNEHRTMILKFTHDFKILTIVQTTELELEMLEVLATQSAYSYRTKKTYSKCLLSNWKYLPAGLWSEILALRKSNWHVVIENLSDFVRNDMTIDQFYEWVDTIPLKFPPYPYQVESAYKLYKFRIGRLSIGTGGGKSYAQYLLCRFLIEKHIEPGKKILLVVPKISLCGQMERDFYDYQLDEYVIVDKIYGGSARTKNANVIVGNIDSLVNMPKDFFDDIVAVLFDEAHKMQTKGYQTIMHFLNQSQIHTIVGVSGTFYPRNTIEGLVESAYLGPILVSKTTSELEKFGSITPVKINIMQLNYGRLHSFNYYHQEDIDKLNGRYRIEVSYIQSLSIRFLIITSIIRKIKGNQILLFNTREYTKMFEDYLLEHATDREVFRIVGGIPVSERDKIVARLEQIDNGIICATYATLDTGVSIKNIHHLHMIDDTKSFIRVRQSIGRAVRLHATKKFAQIWDWTDYFWKQRPSKKNPDVKEWPGPAVNIMYRHSKARIKIYTQQKLEHKITTIAVPDNVT